MISQIAPDKPKEIACAWCSDTAESDDICNECGGCPMCCCEDMHCQYCTEPFGVCTCEYRFANLNDPDDWFQKTQRRDFN